MRWGDIVLFKQLVEAVEANWSIGNAHEAGLQGVTSGRNWKQNVTVIACIRKSNLFIHAFTDSVSRVRVKFRVDPEAGLHHEWDTAPLKETLTPFLFFPLF